MTRRARGFGLGPCAVLAGAEEGRLELDVDAGELALVDDAGAEEALLELDAGELAAASTTLLELDRRRYARESPDL
jgi:hypothetical protein